MANLELRLWRAHDKDVDEIEHVEVPLKVNSSNVTVEEYSEADGPNPWCVPPVAQPILHQREASGLVGEFLHIRLTIDNEDSG
jgi:hypothetical protein